MTSPETEAATLTAVLRHFSWAPVSGVSGVYEVWAVGTGDQRVIVPLDPAKDDYGELLERARQYLLAHHGRVAEELFGVFAMRAASRLDSTRWSKETSVEGGLIGWERGESLYTSARAQLVAAAKSAREDRRYHGNASSFVAKRFLESSFMGQTEIGSFVITAYTPARQRFHISRHSEEVSISKPSQAETISGSEILDKFESALNAMREGLDEYRRSPNIELFFDTVPEGVSYEFARALGEIVAEGDSAIEVIRQSGSAEGETTAEVAFAAVESPIISQVARNFALDPAPVFVDLEGDVTLLSRSKGSEDRLIRLELGERSAFRKVRVRLSAAQYEVAMEAHRQEARLHVSGMLEREGRLFWLYNAEDLLIVPSEADDEPAVDWTPPLFNPRLPSPWDDEQPPVP